MSDKKSGEAPAPKPATPPQRPPLTVSTNAEEKPTHSTLEITIRNEE